jgi:UDP-N-acetyl-D-mannosaminuronic acid dehydrogenase
MAKLTENSFRDVNIAFANELSMICDHLDIDVWEMIRLANRHPRVNILTPGPGVGGHCIAVDPWFIVNSAPDQAKLVRLAREVNDYKPEWVLQKVESAIAQIHREQPTRARSDLKVACLGVAFKPNIDDLRESPALRIARDIAQLGSQVLIVEPNVASLPEALCAPNIQQVTLDDALAQADVVCVLVRHRSFDENKRKIIGAAKLIDTVGLAS